MIADNGNLVITFNGEIYNYPALRTKLESDGVRFVTNSDTETLLHLYARHGPDMVRQLRGMFAFAIWDERNRGLLLARDLYGIKPLYTADDGKTFRFASQVKALLAGGQISCDIEPAGVVGFYLFGSVPEPFTLYRQIRPLPAGHTQWIDETGCHEPRPYANISEILGEARQNPLPKAELRQRLHDCALDSVRAHLLADVEVGIFLSAGVDSAALLALTRDAGHRDIRAITLAFDEFHDTPEDEAPHAARMAARYSACHIVRRVNEKEFNNDLSAIFEAMDQPSIDGINSWFIAKAAKEVGLKVALSGIGGDELLAGYPSFTDVPQWRRQYGSLANVPGAGALGRILARALTPRLARRQPKALGLFQYSGSLAGAYLLRRGLFLPPELPSVIDKDIAREGLRRLKPVDYLSSLIKPDPGSDVGRVCALESSHYLRNQLLRDADWAGMAHSIEIRVPLVDAQLLKSFAPALAILVPGEGKAILAKSPSIPLPAEIIERGKTGFAVPTGPWMKNRLRRSSDMAGCAVESKGVISRGWSRFVLPSVIATSELARIDALVS